MIIITTKRDKLNVLLDKEGVKYTFRDLFHVYYKDVRINVWETEYLFWSNVDETKGKLIIGIKPWYVVLKNSFQKWRKTFIPKTKAKITLKYKTNKLAILERLHEKIGKMIKDGRL